MITNRETIAAALSTVAGVTGYATRPDILSSGDAYPLVDTMLRGPGAAFETRWRVIVILAGDEYDAIDQLDSLAPAITEALAAVAFVDSVTPIAVSTSAGDLFAAEFIARSE